MSDQTPHSPPDSGAQQPPFGGGWPSASTPEQAWATPPGTTPPSLSKQPPEGTPPAGGWPQPAYPAQGTPAPGGWPQTAQQPGTPAPGGWPQPTAPQPGTPAPGYPQPTAGYTPTTPYPDQSYQTPGAYPPGGGYPQPPYPQGPYTPQPQPGGQWQGQPPQKSNRSAVIVLTTLAVVAVIVIAVVVGLAVNRGGSDTPVAAPSNSLSPAPAGSSALSTPSAQVTAPAGNSHTTPPPGCNPIQAPSVGQTVTVRGDADTSISTYTATITLNSICSTSAPLDSGDDEPEYGRYVVANFTVKVISGEINVFPLSFGAETSDGTTYEATYKDLGTRLDRSDVQGGQQVIGTVVFDVPPDANLIYWKPLFATDQAEFRY